MEAAKNLAYNKQLFEKAVNKAQKSFKSGKLNSAMAWAQIGADFAEARHPGFYADKTLESLLLEIAAKLGNCEKIKLGQPNISLNSSGKKKVLHVLTEALVDGGHTRVVTEWIKNTSDTCISGLVTTDQKGPLPTDVASTLKKTGGWYRSLSVNSPNLIARAQLLNQLSRDWADLVVLHIHPYDAIAIVAFGVEDGSPVIFFNHAGHVFWLGASVADAVADILPWQQETTLNRHGVKNSKILPIPIPKPSNESNYDEARKKLGLQKNNVMLLTIGGDFKYTPYAGYNFIEVLLKILKKHPNAILFAIGPRNQGKWAKASDQVNGRIRALGSMNFTKLHTFYDASDIYVDSFPLAGGVALLQAGVLGKPLIGLREKEAPNINLSGDVALRSFDIFAPSVEAFHDSLENMITEPLKFRDLAYRVKEKIEAAHCSPGWNRYLDEVLQSLPLQHSTHNINPLNFPPDSAEVFLEGFQAAYQSDEDPYNCFGRKIFKNSRYLSQMERARILPDIMPRIKDIQTLKDSIGFVKKALFE